MKNLKHFLTLFVTASLFLGCASDDDSTQYLQDADAPANLSAIFTITQDNSGKVTIRPNGEGATSYSVVFGDSSIGAEILLPGETVDHIYPEGIFQVKITATGINGLTTELIQPLTVSFQEPQNLSVSVVTGSNRSVTVSATADLETYFQVYFGEDPAQIPVDFMEGTNVTYSYALPGTYEIRVVALSGGSAFAEHIENVVITNLAPAPDPTVPASSVISLFSNVYTDVPVDTWKTSWSQANLDDIDISGNDAKKYSALNFVGIETVASQINATTMTHFHTDVWSSDFTTFRIKLVDFGANGAFGGGDDVEHEIAFPNLAQEQWVSLDIPLSSFTGLTTRAHIAQLIYSAAPSGATTVYVDNVYFYNQSATLSTPAPTPTWPAANVISMFSEAYTSVPVNTWKTSWSSATFQDIFVAGNAVKKYSDLNFVGVEATSTPIDATSMTHFHTDFWSADCTTFKIKLVDFGANGLYNGPGSDDVEHELTFTPPQNTWVSYDIPLSDFVNLTTRAHIAQLIYVGAPSGNNTIYIDNVYFHN